MRLKVNADDFDKSYSHSNHSEVLNSRRATFNVVSSEQKRESRIGSFSDYVMIKDNQGHGISKG